MPPMPNKASLAKQAKRRVEVWRLREQGLSVREIAKRLGEAISTVGKDIKAVEKEYRTQAKQSAADVVTKADGADAERRVKVWALRKNGGSIATIARTLNLPWSTVHADILAVIAELKAAAAETAEEARLLDLDRIDKALFAISAMVEGKNLNAIDRWIKLLQLRSELLGSKSPKSVDVTSGGERIKGYIGISPDDWDDDAGDAT